MAPNYTTAADDHRDEQLLPSSSMTEPLLPMNEPKESHIDSNDDADDVGIDQVIPQRQTKVVTTTVNTDGSTSSTSESNDQSPFIVISQQQTAVAEISPTEQPLESSNNSTTTTTPTTTTTRSSSSSYWWWWWWNCSCNRSKNVLAFSSTTNCCATLLVPLLIVATHLLFLYGQTSDMWSLRLHTDLDVQYKTTTYTTHFTFDALNLPQSDHYQIPNHNRIVQTFTYMYAMEELWQAKDMPGLFLPRLAAAGLFVFSGIWPHLKLLLLHITWFTPYRNPRRRQRMLSYLSVLGKWSLVDVLVVCVMVGVLRLQYTFTSQHAMDMIQSHLSNVVTIVRAVYNADDLCSLSLKYSCATAKRLDHIADCKTCISVVKTWFAHPDSVHDILQGIETEGGGEVQLSVVGLHGIYAFCGAVIVSILLSFVVDYYDFKCRTAVGSTNTNNWNDALPGIERSPEENHDAAAIQENVATGDMDDCDDAILNQLILAAENGGSLNHHRLDIDPRSTADRDFDRNIRIENNRTKHIVWQAISWITILVVIGATFAITMERRVYGAIPMLLQETFDIVWTKQYNFVELAYTTALAGEWDYLLMATFVWFIIAGPILRALLCIIANRYNETSTMSDATIIALYRTKRHLSVWIDFIGAFCAWEVLVVAVVMVDLLMPSITNTILIDPRCAQIVSPANDDNGKSIDPKNLNCFEMEFDIMKSTFWMVIVGGIVLLLVSGHVRNNLQPTER